MRKYNFTNIIAFELHRITNIIAFELHRITNIIAFFYAYHLIVKHFQIKWWWFCYGVSRCVLTSYTYYCLHKWELNCSSLSTRSAPYGGHSIVQKPQRNAVAARWCSSPSPSGKIHQCISECKQRKCLRLSSRITRLKHN